jgi:hypothetical protein
VVSERFCNVSDFGGVCIALKSNVGCAERTYQDIVFPETQIFGLVQYTLWRGVGVGNA